MRSEFISISTAFDAMPRLTTTGLFDTVFNQAGSYTFTLPPGPGVLARITDAGTIANAAVALEATRAGAAETALSATITALGTSASGGTTNETTRALLAEAGLGAQITAEANTRLAQDGLLAPKLNPAVSGTLTLTDASTGNNAPLSVVSRNNAAGAGIGLLGNGATTPNKYVRVLNGQFQIVNSAYNQVLFTMDDAGNGSIAGSFAPAGGIPALTTETNRALAAEAILRTGVSGAQSALGYTPVQQGTGIGQANNVVKIGWTGLNLACTVDSTSQGFIVTTANPQGFALGTQVTAETTRAVAAEAAAIAAVNNEANARVAGLATKLTSGADANVGTLNTSGPVIGQGNVFANSTATNFGFFLVGSGTGRAVNWTSDGWKLLFNTQTGLLAQYNSAGSALFNIDINGNLLVPGNVNAANVSDARTKRAITPYGRGLAAVIGLEPISYEYNGLGGTTDDGKTRWGVTAQQAQAFLPECVHETVEPGTDPTREGDPVKIRLPGQLSVNEQPLLYAMVNAFREVSAELDALKARLAVLEAR